jgi:hypothetical protein
MALKRRNIFVMFFSLQTCLLLLVVSTKVKAQGVDNPLPLELGITSKVSLDENERTYFNISLHAGAFKVILDTRRTDEQNGNLISSLSLLDQEGATLEEGAIRFNEIDVDFRRVHSFSLKLTRTIDFKLSNDNSKATFWLTVVKEATPLPIPFFGNVTPKPIQEGESKSGLLDTGESAYYIIDLKKGDYKAFLDFANSLRQNTNIQGYLAILNADGGAQEVIINLNEIDVAYRKVATFSVKKDATLIIRVENTIYRVNFVIKIVPA